MKVRVGNEEYSVRNNYLHRGRNPRLVLNHRVDGKYVFIQFDNLRYFEEAVLNKKQMDSFDISGLWCVGSKFSHVVFKIILE